jgi:hypothetical protein
MPNHGVNLTIRREKCQQSLNFYAPRIAGYAEAVTRSRYARPGNGAAASYRLATRRAQRDG